MSQPDAGLPRIDFDSVLFKRRRFRAAKACYPCRRRKVKCNLNRPCETCISRGHADLCEYRPGLPPSGATTGTQDTTPPTASSCSEHGSDATTVVVEMTQGLFLDPIQPYNSKVHLGQESLPNILSTAKYFAVGGSRPRQDAQTIFELLCLQDSSSTFPFTNLWSPDDEPEAVYAALPEDETVMAYFEFGLSSICRIMPTVIDIDEFKESLRDFFTQRANSPPDTLENLPPKCTPAWFGVLFGILACSVQLASSEVLSEANRSRVFACCAFHCLTMSNFVSYPSVETIQALLMLVNFLRNQADANGSWSILGLTIRLAQSMGLHCLPHLDTVDDPVQKKQLLVKQSLWRSLLWQDTLVSMSFGRPPSITILEDVNSIIDTMPPVLALPGACYRLFIIANKISQALLCAKATTGRLSIETIRDFKQQIYKIEGQLVPHMQDYSKCQQLDDYVEHNVYRVLSDSVVLCLCRPAVLLYDDDYSLELVDIVLSRCRSVLRVYLELLNLQCPTRRSWIYVHAALSCALTLGIATDAKNQVADRELLRVFFDRISQATICANVPAYENALRQLKAYLDAYGQSNQLTS